VIVSYDIIMRAPPFKITNKTIDLISKISQILGEVDASGTKKPKPKLRKQNKIKTIQATLAIEGNTLTLDQVSAVLEGKKVLGPKNEIIEVKNTIELYDRLSKYKYYSVNDFLASHKTLMKNLIDTNGNFRSKNVGVLKGTKVSHLAPKPRLVPELVENLLSWSKKETELHLLILSSVLHYEIEFIHPFEDGNGRIGRFWQTLTLSKLHSIFSYLPIESLIKDNQQQYYDTLEACDKQGESTSFIEFMLGLIHQSLKDFSKDLIGITHTSMDRLNLAKDHFIKEKFSRKDYMGFFKTISSATASRDLKEGIDLKILKKTGSTNQTRYIFIMRG